MQNKVQSFLSSTIPIWGLIISSLVSYGIIFYSRTSDSNNIQEGRIQNSHTHDASRYGGVAIALGLLGVVAYDYATLAQVESKIDLLLLFACFALIIGLIDDFLGHVAPTIRALSMFVITLLAGAYIGWLDKVNIDLIDNLVENNLILAATITVIGVVGLTNSFNLIDGLNGLCSGTVLVVVGVLSFLSWKIGIYDLCFFYVCVFMCVCGFFIFNYPFGKIFLGDGGAYFLGFLIAEGSILLNSYDSDLSSWVFVLLCIYPIWETIFSMLRRLVRKEGWAKADRRHLHQIVFDNFRKGKSTGNTVKDNALASSICLLLPCMSGVLSVLFCENSQALQIACVSFVVLYLLLYVSLSLRLAEVEK